MSTETKGKSVPLDAELGGRPAHMTEEEARFNTELEPLIDALMAAAKANGFDFFIMTRLSNRQTSVSYHEDNGLISIVSSSQGPSSWTVK